MNLKSKIAWGLAAFTGLVAVVAIGVGTTTFWTASSTILAPAGPGDIGNIAGCRDLTREFWGEDCGRMTDQTDLHQDPFLFRSPTGYALAGWTVKRVGMPKAIGVVLYVPGGGSDRREATRYVPMFSALGLDVIAFDPVCSGLSECGVPGVSYGARESLDIAKAADVASSRYERVFVMGSSMGALSILRALPELRGVSGIVLENPMASLERLLRDAPQSKGMPDWAVDALSDLVAWRGQFPDVPQADIALAGVSEVPMLFIHSRKDSMVPVSHSEFLASVYPGPVNLWLADEGDHGRVWNANPAVFEAQVARFIRPLLAQQWSEEMDEIRP